MNQALRDPFELSYPELIETRLSEGYAICCEFNKRGDFLATGCADGTCVIWDVDTKSVACVLSGHTQEISCVSWLPNTRKLLTSSQDGKCILWDLKTFQKDRSVQFLSSVQSADLHPSGDWIVACPSGEVPVLVHMPTNQQVVIQICEVNNNNQAKDCALKQDHFLPYLSDFTAACFDQKGDHLYMGNSRGWMAVLSFDSSTRQVQTLFTLKISSAAIKSIQLCQKTEKEIAVNSADRVIRLYAIDELFALSLEHRFQDLVNRVQWSQCRFSYDDEYVAGGTHGRTDHNIYIWDTKTGSLIKMLEGPKEGLSDFSWHPIRPMMASVSAFGNVYLWSIHYKENWSAYAPNFRELEENVEYDEKEDEFDVVDKTLLVDHVEQIEEIDVIGIENRKEGVHNMEQFSLPFSSDSVFYLPVIPRPDIQKDDYESSYLDTPEVNLEFFIQKASQLMDELRKEEEEEESNVKKVKEEKKSGKRQPDGSNFKDIRRVTTKSK